MTTAQFYVGDALTVLRTLPDASVDLVVTSSPFLALRAYLPGDHPNKALELGTEPTPGEFIDALLDVVVESRRVVAPHGSICFELGDTYSGTGGGGGGDNREGHESEEAQREANAENWRQKNQRKTTTVSKRRDRAEVPRSNYGGSGWPEAKSLCLIPEIFRFALVYGFNPLTGRQIEPWRARNVIRWCRPNPPVGALGDKVRPATSDIIVACTSRTRFFDLTAVRTPHKSDPAQYSGNGYTKGNPSGEGEDHRMPGNPLGAPPLDHWWFDEVDDVFPQDAWLVSARGYRGSHYATYPPPLIDRLVQAMTPPKVCMTCGEPSRRIVEAKRNIAGDQPNPYQEATAGQGRSPGYWENGSKDVFTEYTTVGWTDCGHDTWRRGVVLDPFAGTGTTLAVATGHGHDAIGIDLDARNLKLALERVGMFLEEAHLTTQGEP